jgi:enamine deaminase RidA (YjgF/YER057c/UK114 family)
MIKTIIHRNMESLSFPASNAVLLLSRGFQDEIRVSIKRINIGPRMSSAVVHGDTVYLSGQVASETKGQSVTLQTEEVLKQIDELLAEAGSDKSKIVQASIFIADMSSFAEMNAVWDAWVSAGNTPCRTTIEAKLAAPQYAIEIAVIAAL